MTGQRYIAAFCVFAAGGAVGFVATQLLTTEQPDAKRPVTSGAAIDSEANARQRTEPATRTAIAAVPQNVPPTGDEATANENPSDVDLDAHLREAQLERERLDAALRGLRAEVAALRAAVESTRAPGAEAPQDTEESDPAPGDERRPRQVDTDSLLDAGFAVEDASFIARRWGEQQMALLRLRTRAEREGWLDDARYEEAVRELRRGPDSLRGTLDEDEYDRFLFGTGRSNRVRVAQVFEGSPAQAAGIGPDDVVRRYDDTPVYTFEDLRAAISADAPDDEATVEIERDGRLVEVIVPRGPIGVQVRGLSVEP